ncbi:MAG: hypothetical protein BWY93_02212 [Euryarchaeota archaeon ADurb.BinA087]|nr:MAG: hypothetical protein BWY93_02212 [Euryarchaeota archaeon ADurb.BinA087]
MGHRIDPNNAYVTLQLLGLICIKGQQNLHRLTLPAYPCGLTQNNRFIALPVLAVNPRTQRSPDHPGPGKPRV